MSYESHLNRVIETQSVDNQWIGWLMDAEAAVCGHKYTNHSFANEETGCIHFECTKCGHEVYTVLY